MRIAHAHSVDALAMRPPQLGPLEFAILSSIAYRDQFGYPLTLPEIHRYLHWVACDETDVANALGSEPLASRYLVTDGAFHALARSESLFALRAQRAQLATRLWARARRLAALLAALPQVRMIAVTGSLACSNPADDADIDIMLVTEPGALWRTRAAAKLMQIVDRKLGGGLCANYLVTEKALELPVRGLYVAQELAQMVPLYGEDVYRELRARNRWTEHYLPNAAGPPRVGDAPACRKSGPLHAVLTPLFRNPLADALEHWESARKIARYNHASAHPGTHSEYSRDSTGQRVHVRDEIETAYESRLRRSCQDPAPMKVLVGQAYHLKSDSKLWRSMQPYPPLGSLIGAAVVRRDGHDVAFFDAMLSTSSKDWPLSLDRHRPDVVVLFEDNFNYLTKMCLLAMRRAGFDMIRAARATGARVVVSSSDASDHPELYLQAGAGFILLGEGELALSELLRRLARHEEPQDGIAGLAWLDPDGKLVRTPRRPVARQLEELPPPAWDLVDLDRYRRIWKQHHGYFSLNIQSTRGCPYHCNWCAKPIWGQRYNARSPEAVVDEIADLSRLAAPDHYWIMDDIFGLKPHWIARFGDLLAERGMAIRFKCLSRPDLLLRPGEIDALARAGCEVVWMGAESGSQKVLDAMEKGTTVADIEAASAELRRRGVRFGWFIQFGYPGESWRDIRETMRLIRRVQPDQLGISVSYPLPGTRFYERVRHELGEKRNWEDSDDLAMMFRGPYTTAFYRWLHRTVHLDLHSSRIRSEFASGVMFSMPWRRQMRRWFSLAVHTVVTPLAWGWLAVLACLPHRGTPLVEATLNRPAAATPSPQAED
jgi:anaerobic magnesium-protoporphyrin IX monomethyl ester cyclase